MAAIAQASGMDMRVFPRDKNLDIMNLYLNQGKFMSIPVFAFFDRNLNPLCHWIERPKSSDSIHGRDSSRACQEKTGRRGTAPGEAQAKPAND